MRRKIVAGNWKMNKDLNASIGLVQEILQSNKIFGCEVYISPAFPFLNEISKNVNQPQLKLLHKTYQKNMREPTLVKFHLIC
jgi:triosephosphate isomerase